MGKREKAVRRENDHYVTPDWAIARFLEVYDSRRFARVLDPCAAKGELLTEVQKFVPTALLAACDLNPEFAPPLKAVTQGATIIGDFLQHVDIFKRLDIEIVLTNPPYNQATKFIQASLRVAPVVAMLLRINFLASQKRRDFLAEQRPGIFVLPNRPSFTGGGADQTEYAWFVFGDERVAGRIEWLELTPAEEIKASNQRARVIHADKPLLICRDCGADTLTKCCSTCGGEAGLSEGTAEVAA